MKILSLETSGKLCGVCISENEQIVDIIEQNNGLTHSESLMPQIQILLNRNNLKISDFDAFVCDIGPGSFTGIRIGVASTKAFVDCYENVKYTGVSSLEALAYNVKKDGLICSIIDCKNNNCYFSLFDLQNNVYNEVIPPTAASILELFNTLNSYNSKSIIFIGDGVFTYKNEIQQNISNALFLEDDYNKINTQNLALAGFNKLKNRKLFTSFSFILKKASSAETIRS